MANHSLQNSATSNGSFGRPETSLQLMDSSEEFSRSDGTDSAIKAILRNQKCFLDTFNKYQGEMRSLQMMVNSRFKRLNCLEKELLELAENIQCDTEHYMKRKQSTNRKCLMNGRSNKFSKRATIHQQYSEVIDSLMEPIIDIHVTDDDDIEDEEVKQEFPEVEILPEVEGTPDQPISETRSVASNRLTRKVHTHVTSKTEFIKLVDRYSRKDNLIRERVSKNVLALQAKDTDSIIGYQCSIDGCNYMHFLRAQVNRHYKNYHNKTCNHCNQRFKKPIDLLIHLNENKLDGGGECAAAHLD